MKSKLCLSSSIILAVCITFFAVFFCFEAYNFCQVEAVSTLTKETRQLPILMYHSVLNSRKGAYIISEKQFENDLQTLMQLGYQTVSASQVIAYAEGRGTLPEKPIMLTFDDGHFNNLYYTLPILKRFNAKALFNVIGEFSEYSSVSGDNDNPNYSHLTWEEMKILKESGLVEIGNHSYSLHRYRPRFGVSKMQKESLETYRSLIENDTMMLQNKIKYATGSFPQAYAYPFGKYNEYSEKILADCNIKMTLTCAEKGNVIVFNNTSSIKKLNRFNRNGAYHTVKVILDKIK